MAEQYRDKILSIVKIKGAVLPTQIALELKIDSMIASAMLSEMTSHGMLKISNIKIGSSPLYYDPTRPEILENYTTSLKNAERESLQLLKNSKVIRDGSLSPVARVALQGLKDFAIPLDVTIGTAKEIFWKWYLLNDKEAETIIIEIIEGPRKKTQPEEQKEQQITPPPRKKSPGRPKKITLQQKQEKLTQERKINTEEEKTKKQNNTEQTLQESTFGEYITRFLKSGAIQIIESTEIKKGKEYDLTIKVPSPIGPLIMYSKAKEKKKINDADLSVAFVEGQLRKLPVIYISTGTLEKGLDAELEKRFKGLTFKTI